MTFPLYLLCTMYKASALSAPKYTGFRKYNDEFIYIMNTKAPTAVSLIKNRHGPFPEGCRMFLKRELSSREL